MFGTDGSNRAKFRLVINLEIVKALGLDVLDCGSASAENGAS